MNWKLFKDNNIRAMIAASVTIVALSWYRVFTAGTLAVDGHGLTGTSAALAFALFTFSLLVFGTAWFRFWKLSSDDIRSTRSLVYILILIFLLMAPMLSSDVFSYLALGDTSNKAIDVFTDAGHLSLSSYYSYLSPLYQHMPCIYGPVALMLFKLSAWLGNGHIWQAWAAYKIITLLFAVVFTELAFKVNARLGYSGQPLLFLLLNPIFLIQGVGQVHPDLVAGTFVLSAIYFLLAGRWHVAFVLVSVAAAVKLSYILMLPFIIGAVFFMLKDNRGVLKVITGTGLSILSLLLIYFPFFSSVHSFFHLYNSLLIQYPTKSIAQLLGDVSYFIYTLIGHNMKELGQNVNTPHYLPPALITMYNIATKAMQLLALVTSAYILYKFIKGPHTLHRWLKVYIRLLLLFLLVYSHIFYSWYLFMFLPFVWGIEKKADIKWLIVLTAMVQIQDLTVALNRSTAVYMAAIIISYLCIIVYVWRYKGFFIDLETSDAALKDIPGNAAPVKGDYAR